MQTEIAFSTFVFKKERQSNFQVDQVKFQNNKLSFNTFNSISDQAF